MKYLLALLLAPVVLCVHAQSLTPEVQASSGDFYTGGGVTLSWTLGETVTETYSSPSNIVTQGFQQPDVTVTKVEEATAGVNVVVFPNPTAGQLSVELTSVASRKMQLELVDINGRLLHSQQAEVPAGVQTLTMDIASLAAGQYMLRVKDTGKKTESVYRIQKNK